VTITQRFYQLLLRVQDARPTDYVVFIRLTPCYCFRANVSPQRTRLSFRDACKKTRETEFKTASTLAIGVSPEKWKKETIIRFKTAATGLHRSTRKRVPATTRKRQGVLNEAQNSHSCRFTNSQINITVRYTMSSDHLHFWPGSA
jgi:hypothetical protein